MMKRMSWAGGLLALTLAASMPAGCEADVYDDGGVVEVDQEPPPPQAEVVPVAPYPGAIWIGGSWVWRGGRHEWVGGRYVHPRRGYVYEQHRWSRNGNRWRYEPGRWHRR